MSTASLLSNFQPPVVTSYATSIMPTTVALSVMIGICVFAVINNAIFALRKPVNQVRLLFAILSALAAVFAAFDLGLYRSSSVEEYLFIHRLISIDGLLFFIVLTWFGSKFFHTNNTRVNWIFTAMFSFLIVVTLVRDNCLYFKDVYSLATRELPWGEHISYLQASFSIWAYITWLTVILLFGFLLYNSFMQLGTEKRDRAINFSVALILFLSMVLVNFLIDLGLINFLYPGVFGFTALIIVMSITISSQVQKNAKILAGKEAHLRLAINAAHIGTWNWDIVNNVVTWTDGVHKLFGLQLGEFDGTYESYIKLLEPDAVKAIETAIKNSLEGFAPYYVEHRLFWPDKSEHWFACQGEVERDGKGKALSMRGTVMDITERVKADQALNQYHVRLEEQVQQRTAELKAINKELESFAYSVSHDLRAPLRSINGFSTALLEDYYDKLDETGKEYLERLINASDRMGHLIDDLLQLSRLSRSDMMNEQVNLSQLADFAINKLQSEDTDRQVITDIEPNLIVSGDTRLLGVVIDNLIDNAWKYSSKKTTSKIEFGVSQQGKEKVYFVRDNGAGFNMRYVDKLFGAFQRLHSVSDFEGTGIGLATVQRLVQRHGGRVWAEGEVDKGATFYFTLGNL